MYKVMVVEDEMLVRMGIIASVDWAEFDMNVIADVSDGQAALEVYKRNKPDLILTDLKMPFMGGMELIKKIRETDSTTKIIILTCMEEFELAREALSLNVSDYILKLTMSQKDMENVLKKVRKELAENDSGVKLYDSMSSNSGSIEGKIVHDYLFYGIYPEDKFGQLVEKLKIPLTSKNLVLCIMEIDHYELMQNKFGDEHGHLICFSFLNIINELLAKYENGIVFRDKENVYVLIFSINEDSTGIEIRNKLYGILEHISRALRTYLDTSVTFGVSSFQDGYSRLKEMYNEAMTNIKYKYFSATGIIIGTGSYNHESLMAESIEKLKVITGHSQILGDRPKAVVKEEIDVFVKSFSLSKKNIINLFHKLGQQVLLTAPEKDDEILFAEMKYSQQIDLCETLDECIGIFGKFVSDIKDASDNPKRMYSKEIVSVIKYIKENFGEYMSLQQVSEIAGLSASYLCSLFRKEMGVGLIDFLNHYRIEKAKELFLTTNLKSYEIAEKVGFTDDSYFSRTFKKITGKRPNDFRKQRIKAL